MEIFHAVPVLQVADVGVSVVWYRGSLGWIADPFPSSPPFQFAILRHGKSEIMLQRGSPGVSAGPRQYHWDVYLRLGGGTLRQLYARLSDQGIVTRRLERMFYGLAEFEITDPDGHVLCLSEELVDADDLPTPVV